MRFKLAGAFIAASSLLAAQSVFAADMPIKMPVKAPPAQIVNWTGFYIGANIGGSWARDSITTTTGPATFLIPPDNYTPTSLNLNSVIGGVQAGYNWQWRNIVLGIEGDVNWLNGKASRVLLLPPPSFIAGDFFSDAIKNSFLATVRPRIGVTFDRALFYATGGLAVAKIETIDSFGLFNGTSVQTISSATTRTGWTAGGGIEYAVANNWSAKLEYLHVGLGSFNTFIPANPGVTNSTVTVQHKYSDDIVRVGLNYRLGSPY